MHLLAAQPGGFVDDEGIIDLAQDSADIVVLSAADSSLSALSKGLADLHEAHAHEAMPSVRLANWMQLLKPAAYDLYEHKVLEDAQVVVVSLLGGASYWAYALERLIAWQSNPLASKARQLIVVPGDDQADPELAQACSCAPETAFRVWRYLREGGVDNACELFKFLFDSLARHNGQKAPSDQASIWRWQEPKPLAKCLIYQPQVGQSTLLAYQRYWAKQEHEQEGPQAPQVLLLFYRSHLQSANTEMFDGFIAALEAQNLRVLPLAIASLKDELSLNLANNLIADLDAKLVINATGFATNTVASPDLSSEPSSFNSPFEANIPVLQVVLSGSTEQDWQTYKQGLRARDLAMQVVLPEMDGRIVARAISFKTESRYDELAQASIVQYQLHPERAEFCAKLAKAYCNLASRPAQQKRVALILANYPTKDGRIGNGVGLDTPASALNILRAMKAAGYPVSELPEHGNGLIERLLESITNNPNTLDYLPCWQSLSLVRYRELFAQLPENCQQAVLERWGEPEQDHKHRQGQLMIAGMRLGETFVGIQPARGFNIDLVANYHDPDLIPPHSYLAYYFWLREVYKVDAIVHVGKHGNLEWLPGKGSALSGECWPDIALGPMPHFYPFIVNDPGEGAQAKRRTHAAIIDHLMPPMTRAESYGELAELEALVDEYYQALGMDSKREDYLREAILNELKRSHVLEELGGISLNDELGDGDDEALLNELDAYLCDIKEAQIRHGLHILGELPAVDKLADTLVALLRLPRGTKAHSQGILHSIAQDLGLNSNALNSNCVKAGQDDSEFDPLAASTQVWQGSRPDVLANVYDDAPQTQARLWRTEADTRERLELYAKHLVLAYVLPDFGKANATANQALPRTLAAPAHDLTALAASLPNTAKLLAHAKASVLRALSVSAEQEIKALLGGLSGRRIDPGPSGAPTRGRLDTLPTGRNFFSVDNRSIPSPSAWALGQRSAQALIDRHLQEHGDYPRTLGLSVWGTATMRTGGDDIAQAFALMGVEPIYAPGSQRVVDFKVLSTQLMGRPRVDVTLRVSGFFRDAFPNVMRLFDAAVQAIIALEEPGNENWIAQHAKARTAELVKQGYSDKQAQREASYRVFGSKPGAYGAGLQGLIDERCWEQRSDLAEAYLNWGGYAYGSDADGKHSADGVAAHGAFAHQLSQLEVVAQNQDNREHDILDSDDYYQFQGGMSNAVEVYAGHAPTVYHNDHANPASPKIRTLKEELNRVLRSRMFNPKWITAMREHGYKGAFEMGASIDYMFAYDATTNMVDDYQYAKACDSLLFDEENKAFLEANNPQVFEEMAERMLEAVQRGLWAEPDAYADKLQDLLLEMDEKQESASSAQGRAQ